MLNINDIRRDFPILSREVNGKPLVYLDSGASAQKPQVVIDAITQAYSYEYANVHRGLHYLSNLATDKYEAVRGTVAKFLNAASEDEIVFNSGTTEGINTVAYGWAMPRMQAGDEIILSVMEHHANIVPWHFLRERQGVVLKWVDVDSTGALDPQAVIDAITSHAWEGDAATALDQLLDTFVQTSSDFPPSQLAMHDQIISETVTIALASDNPVGIFLEQCEKLGGDKWLERAAATFKSGTPTTAAIIYEQIQRAKSMTREQIFAMELTLAIQCSRHADFREGIRALLIEKDNTPNWQYKMGAVPNEWVAAHFAEPWPINPLSDLN